MIAAIVDGVSAHLQAMIDGRNVAEIPPFHP
jgi:hypothetical protein